MQVSFGNHLKIARQRLGMTQYQASAKLFVSEETIRNYENGKTKPTEEFILEAEKIYKDDTLGMKYLSLVSEIGRRKMAQAAVAFEVCKGLHQQLGIIMPQLADVLSSAMQLSS